MRDPEYPIMIPFNGELNLSPSSNRFWDMTKKGLFIPFYPISSTITRSDTDPEDFREEVEMREFDSPYQTVYIFDLSDPAVVKVLMCDAAELPTLIGPNQIPFLAMIAKARLFDGIV